MNVYHILFIHSPVMDRSNDFLSINIASSTLVYPLIIGKVKIIDGVCEKTAV